MLSGGRESFLEAMGKIPDKRESQTDGKKIVFMDRLQID
jgi:hypothetical protein